MIKKWKSLRQAALKIDFCTVSIQFPLQGPQGLLLSGSNPHAATGGGSNKGLFDITPPSVPRNIPSPASYTLFLLYSALHILFWFFFFNPLCKHSSAIPNPLSSPL